MRPRPRGAREDVDRARPGAEKSFWLALTAAATAALGMEMRPSHCRRGSPRRAFQTGLRRRCSTLDVRRCVHTRRRFHEEGTAPPFDWSCICGPVYCSAVDSAYEAVFMAAVTTSVLPPR